jgi:signal recognition particle receptor subunit beta
LWKQYYTNAYAVVFVIDSADMGRLPEVKEELSKILHNPELAEARVLIFANKQDIPMAFKPTQIAEFLELSNENHLLTGREFYLQGCCALTGQGVFEGMKWLSTRTRPRRW